jgi:hypothetical protein
MTELESTACHKVGYRNLRDERLQSNGSFTLNQLTDVLPVETGRLLVHSYNETT